MMLKKILPLAICLSCITAAGAQQAFTGGLRAGLTFSTLSGPLETDDQGNALEKYTFSSGFHIGVTFNYSLTDILGLRGEFLFAQKGANYDYEGVSFWVFDPLAGPPVYSTGTRQMSLDVTNSYIEVPLSLFARMGALELSGGINPAFLVGSRGVGELTYSGRSTLGTNVAPFTINLQHQYRRDKYRESIGTDVEARIIEGRPVEIPLNTGAYYEGVDNGQKLYKFLDLGLIGGLSFYFNKSLFLGGRVHYGLPDVTNNRQHISRKALDANRNYVLREDNDRNLVLYLSLGFSL